MAPYRFIKEPGKPYSSTGGSSSQVISIIEEFPITTLTVYYTTRGSQDDTFDMDLGVTPSTKAKHQSKSSSSYNLDLNPCNAHNSIETSHVTSTNI